MLKNYFKLALRNMKKNMVYSFITTFGLAIGLACFIIIVLWIKQETSFDRFQDNKDNLYLLTITFQNGIIDQNTPYALGPLLADEFPEIKGFTRILEQGSITQSSFKYQGMDGRISHFYESNIDRVDKDYFSMFSFPFVKGSPEDAVKRQDSLVINEEIAEKYFGLDNPIGKVMILNNDRNLTVTGVIRVPKNSNLQPDFIIPTLKRMENNWNWRDKTFLMLAPNTDPEEFKNKIIGFMDEKKPLSFKDSFKLGIMPITSVHLGFGLRTYVAVFSLIAFLILFIACLNYVNLAITRLVNRGREVGLRKVSGASRIQIINQFLSESVVTSLISFVLSLLIVGFFLPFLNNLTGLAISIYQLLNYTMILFLLVLVIAIGMIAGIYPALFITRQKTVDTLKGSNVFSSHRSSFRVISVVGQFTISILLIICTGIIFKQINFIQNRPLGFSTDQVIKIPINKNLLSGFKNYKNILKQNPNILNITAGQAVPFDADFKTGGINWEGKDNQRMTMMRYSISHFDYLETFGMEIAAGRSFKNEIKADLNNFVINEKAAEYMGIKNPVGRSISMWGIKGEIIGVVKNYHHVSLHREIMPQIFTVNPRLFSTLKYIFVKISPVSIPETIKFIEEKTLLVAPGNPFAFSFLDRELQEKYNSELRIGKLVSYFAFLAIFISCMGLFGLASFIAEKRTREIGIRKVMGASIPIIIGLLNKRFVKWVLMANILAWPIAYYAASKWLNSFAYRTNIDIWIFLFAGLSVMLIAVITVSLQSIKVAIANPIDSLKYE